MPAVCPGVGGGGVGWSFDLTVATHAGVFRAACISSLVERDEIRALLKTPAWEANLTDTLHITTHHYPPLHITHYFMTTMKQFANDSDETENLSDDEILGKPITPTEIHEHVSKLKTKKASSMNSLLDEMIKHGRYFLRPS